jgi:LmbE family N-acetylglucosaminyl deacetylase
VIADWDDTLAALPDAPGVPSGRIVVLAAHPDDEVLGIGAWLSTMTERSVTFVTATDGEASHPGSPSTGPDELRARRPGELLAALTALGFVDPDVRRLGLPDGGLSDRVDALVDAVTPLVEGAALVLAPFENDGHPDHDATGAAALRACTTVPLWRFPIWVLAWTAPAGQPWLERAHRLPAAPEAWSLKERAVREFTSQVEPLSDDPADAPIVGPELVAHALTGPEVVVT